VKQSVINAWHAFSTPLEGRVHWMYLDILGLVTAGVGNLADPIGLALIMPWVMPDGSPAPHDQIRRDWTALKAQQQLKKLHYKYAANVTKVRLTDAGIDAMVAKKLEQNALYLRQTYFPDWNKWPADAQLGALSMAWAVGPGFPTKFGNFTRFAKEQKWLEAMASCKIRETNADGSPNAGIVPRNRANRLCFANAETVRRGGMDPEVLHWPNEAPTKSLEPVDRDADTVPAFTPDPNIEAVHEARDEELKNG
jgi:GH24 family phage-related lysozyme (muramidase)